MEIPHYIGTLNVTQALSNVTKFVNSIVYQEE